MRWAEMTVECPSDSVEAVCHAYIEAGCGGVMMTGVDPVKVQGSLPVTDELQGQMDALRAHLLRLPEFGLPGLRDGLTVRYAEDEDWATAWKQYFKPLRIGRKLIVKPSWEHYAPADGDLIIELDPGTAFGTGGHPTTRLCLEALEDYVRPGMVVGDIGTGSSILSLGAARLGAARVYATDIDLLPRTIARENVTRNRLDDVVDILEIDAFDARAIDCDLVVANIVANTIVELAPTLPSRLKRGGIFIGSGIVDNHHDLVSSALRSVGLVPVETRREDIWVCLVTRLESTDNFDHSMLAEAVRELPPIGAVGDAWTSRTA